MWICIHITSILPLGVSYAVSVHANAFAVRLHSAVYLYGCIFIQHANGLLIFITLILSIRSLTIYIQVLVIEGFKIVKLL